MRYIFLIILTSLTICTAEQLENKINKDSKFLDATVKNPELQIQINNLKKDYEIELSELKSKFKSEKKSLRKKYKEKLKMVKKDLKKNKKS